MGKETERKFIVSGRFKHLASKEISIIQAYISIDKHRIVRVRISDRQAFITVKSDSPDGSISRKEWEYLIPREDALEIMEICLPGKIEKTRYLVPVGKHTWEVDVFHGKNDGLVIAEIELANEYEVFEKPEWIGKEVTGNPAYYNSNLIK